jgi:hypothetical protein
MTDPELIKQAVKEAVKEHMEEFYVERERHYLDHRFIGDIREGTEKIRSTACGVVTKSLIATGILLLLWGAVHIAEAVFNIRAVKP